MRDLVIAYALALPALAIARRLGVRRTLALWAIAATVGAPMGYALANPLDFAWTPSEQDFEHGAYWGEMISYMALFGLTGAAYALALRTSAGIK